MVVGRLHVAVVEANLLLKEKKKSIVPFRKSHKVRPCTKVRIAGSSFKTAPYAGPNASMPQWNEKFVFFVTERISPFLDVEVLDGAKEEELLSRCRIRFDRIIFFGRQGETVDKWYHLKRYGNKNERPEAAGQIHLKVTIEFDPAYLGPTQNVPKDEFESEGGDFIPNEGDGAGSDDDQDDGVHMARNQKVDAAPAAVAAADSAADIPPAAEGEYQWEYKWQPDATEIFGPYPTSSMRGWWEQGYFVGDMLAYVRLLPGPGITPLATTNEGFIRSDTIDFNQYP